MIALKYQKINGTFICKLFDIFSEFTIKLIYILTIFYKEVYLYKPKTSRGANSEKYIICKYFKGISTDYINKLFILNDKIHKTNNKYLDITGIYYNNNFINKIINYSNDFIDNQIYSINLIINYINNRPSKLLYHSIITEQVKSAILWCSYNNIDINTDSSYYKKFIYLQKKYLV